MRDAKDQPILSTRADDASIGGAIEAFVIGLAERVDELQDGEARGAYAELAARVAELAAEADAAGFGSLARRAESIESACRARNAEEARKQLVELTEIARRIRLGHRGSV